MAQPLLYYKPLAIHILYSTFVAEKANQFILNGGKLRKLTERHVLAPTRAAHKFCRQQANNNKM